MANQQIIDELQSPSTWGLDSIVRTYINPGGVPKDTALSAIEQNTALLNQQDISGYKELLESYLFWDIFSDEAKAAVLTNLQVSDRDKFVSFIVPILHNLEIRRPELVLKSALAEIFPGTSGQDLEIKNNYEALIKEQRSIAQIMGIPIRAGDVEQAMFQLGWII